MVDPKTEFEQDTNILWTMDDGKYKKIFFTARTPSNKPSTYPFNL